MLSSEYVTIDNPLKDESPVTGIYLLNYNLFIYGAGSWFRYDMRGNFEEEFNVRNVEKSEWPILCTSSHILLELKRYNKFFVAMEFDNKEEYRIIFWKNNLEDEKMLFLYHNNEGGDFEMKGFRGAMITNTNKDVLYCCANENDYTVSKFIRNDSEKVWEFVQDLPKLDDEAEAMLQLKLGSQDTILYGTNVSNV